MAAAFLGPRSLTYFLVLDLDRPPCIRALLAAVLRILSQAFSVCEFLRAELRRASILSASRAAAGWEGRLLAELDPGGAPGQAYPLY